MKLLKYFKISYFKYLLSRLISSKKAERKLARVVTYTYDMVSYPSHSTAVLNLTILPTKKRFKDVGKVQKYLAYLKKYDRQKKIKNYFNKK